MGNAWLWLAGLLGAFITALYSFRLLFYVFFGKAKRQPTGERNPVMIRPLWVLAFFAIFAGFLEIPRILGNVHAFSHFLGSALPPIEEQGSAATDWLLMLTTDVVTLLGIWLAYRLFLRQRVATEQIMNRQGWRTTLAFLEGGWGFDWLYDHLFIRPYLWITRVNKHDIVDAIYSGLARLAAWINGLLSRTETGNARWYVAALTVGAIVLIALLVMR